MGVLDYSKEKKNPGFMPSNLENETGASKYLPLGLKSPIKIAEGSPKKSSKKSPKKSPKKKNVKDLEEICIPRNILITWKTKDREGIPDHWLEAYDSTLKMCKGWNIFFHDNEDNRNYVKKYFPDFLETYDGFEYEIQRADAIRYMWLYREGGVYKDMDLEILKPLDELFQENAEIYLVHSANVSSVLTNAFMASKPKQEIWLKMLEYMKKDVPFWAVGKHLHVMYSTGPNALTRVVSENQIKYMTLPSHLCMPCNLCDLGECNTDGAVIRQHEGSSWLNWDGKMYNSFYCGWKNYQIPIVIFLFLCIFLIILLYVDLSG